MEVVVWALLLAVLVCPEPVCPANPTGPEWLGGSGTGECLAGSCQEVEHCTWQSREGVWYSLKDVSNKQFHVPLQNPKGSILKFQLCPHPHPVIPCRNGAKSPTCITVPGVPPSSTGKTLLIEQLEPNIPSMGIRLVYENGDVCEVTKVPRKTVISLPCDFGAEYSQSSWHPKEAWEGKGKEVCHYYIQFPPSKFGCPSSPGGSVSPDPQVTATTFSDEVSRLLRPEILAVTGCLDSDPARTTRECHYAGSIKLTLHGVNFHVLCDPDTPSSDTPPSQAACMQGFDKRFSVFVGMTECSKVVLVSQYQINCTVEKAAGLDQDVVIKKRSLSQHGEDRGVASGGGVAGGEEVMVFKGAVSFKERINYRERFAKFVDMGVGGMKREISELYRRAFASRGTSSELMEQLGVGHVKGILLYGPPGSGKTLLARTISKILGSNQVTLVNGPEIISKYLGDSERNLRLHFKEAHAKWQEFGDLSDLYVIIIDEIDAICKPRGKSDQSAAGVAYDALVNQLLTLMDGLVEVHNTLIIGLTNRRELMDPALLRPGRFEVQIEVSLPDEEGRREIFEIHMREMRRNGLLGSGVDNWELAANTSRLSGAEIAGVVRSASSYALERHYQREEAGLDSAQDWEQQVVVTSMDFSRAIKEIDPAYTHSETHILDNFLPLGFLPCGESHDTVIDSALDMIHVLLSSSVTRTQSLLLYGLRGCGKTTLAAHLAMMGKFSFVKVVTASSLVGKHEAVKVDMLHQTFNDAYKSDTAIIILDDLHRLVEYVQVGQHIQVSHALLHALLTLLTTTPPSHAKLMVIGTMAGTEEGFLQDPTSLSLPDLFGLHQYVPLLGPEEAKLFIAAWNIKRVGGGGFTVPGNLVISVSELVYAVDCACARSDAVCSVKHHSYIPQEHLLNCIMSAVSNT